jgi:hypothetical protein
VKGVKELPECKSRTIFLDDLGTPRTREVVRKTFTQERILPKNKKAFRQLSDDYDYCSWRAHTKIATFVVHLGKTGGGGRFFRLTASYTL